MATAKNAAPATRTYNFTALCKSGSTKSTTFTASSYTDARKKLQDFIEAN